MKVINIGDPKHRMSDSSRRAGNNCGLCLGTFSNVLFLCLSDVATWDFSEIHCRNQIIHQPT